MFFIIRNEVCIEKNERIYKCLQEKLSKLMEPSWWLQKSLVTKVQIELTLIENIISSSDLKNTPRRFYESETPLMKHAISVWSSFFLISF